MPKQQFYIDARWQFKHDWELSSQLNWVGDRERAVVVRNMAFPECF